MARDTNEHSRSSNARTGAGRLTDRHAKILIAMLNRSGGASKSLRYEDIVVEAFERFPESFQLRGYPQYPDASDIHKPLYGPLKSAGYVTSTAKKEFRLTPLGLSTASELLGHEGSLKASAPPIRVDRDAENEIGRLRGTRAYKNYMGGRAGSVVDSDFYAFFKVSVRTKPHEFVGRLSATRELLKAAEEAGQDVDDLEDTRSFLLKKYAGLVEEITGRKVQDAD
jgi:hypothetical protein